MTILIMSRKGKSKRRSVTQICLSDSLVFQMRSLIRAVAINKENSTLLYHKFIIAMFFVWEPWSPFWGNIPQILQVFLSNYLIMCFHINDNLKTIEIEILNHKVSSHFLMPSPWSQMSVRIHSFSDFRKIRWYICCII